MDSSVPSPEDPVVVVGFGFRFPQDAISEDAFWDIICAGKSTMTEVPKSRFNINGFFSNDATRQDTMPCRGGHFLREDVSAFDAPFFGMSASEAKAMDPQLRLLLETTYHALENSGISVDAVRGSATSVYVGNLVVEYSSIIGNDTEINPKYQATGISSSMLSNRLSWFYDLRGPSITIDTACSSSLAGLHLGCQSLLTGESDMSIVGGVQLFLDPRAMTIPLARQNFLSPDGHCYSFDERANGYSRGEGVGIVILKRLSKALQDGDSIRAVIRGTSVNQDGRTPTISQPSPAAQTALIRKAYESQALDLSLTGYFEAHGTGTAVGDPIEVRGISSAFVKHINRDKPLHIGSVKANVVLFFVSHSAANKPVIGHLEAVAGIAGLVKSILVLERGVIPRNALLERLNPAIDVNEDIIKFPTSTVDWPGDGLRRASVNSFGVGGTNAHVVIDDALHYLQRHGLYGRHRTIAQKSIPNGHASNGITTGNTVDHATLGGGLNGTLDGASTAFPLLFPLASADENGIRRLATALQEHINRAGKEITGAYLQDLAFTLSNKRTVQPWKVFALASNAQELDQSLARLEQKPTRSTLAPSIHFIFTGQGAQWASMGVELLQHEVFKESMEYAEKYFHSLGATWSLLGEIAAPTSSSHLSSPQLAQAACTALQVALVDLLASWDVFPEAVVGHSSGEIAAAYCAGGLSKQSALRVAYFRGVAGEKLLLEKETEKGGMLAVMLSEDDLRPHIAAVVGNDHAESLTCGCVNSPNNTTVTGVENYIVKLASRLKSCGILARKLDVPIAYHSNQMLHVAEFYRSTLQDDLNPGDRSSRASNPAFFSSVTGRDLPVEELVQPEYWVRNLVSRVKFSEAVKAMCSSSSGLKLDQETLTKPLTYLIEVGPHCALAKPVQASIPEKTKFVYDFALRRNISGLDTIKKMVGRLGMNGAKVNIEAINHSLGCTRQPEMLVDLPSYPFDHSRTYWIESRLSRNILSREEPGRELLGNPCMDWNPLKPKWRLTIRTTDLPWTLDHQVDGTVLYPAAGMLVMAIEAVRKLTAQVPNIAGYRLRDVSLMSALAIPEGEDGIEAQLHMHSHGDISSTRDARAWEFWLYTVSGEEWKLHCTGLASAEQEPVADSVSEILGSIRSRNSIGTDNMSGLRERCSTFIETRQFYKDLYQQGFHFGEAFQTLQRISVNSEGREGFATVEASDWKRKIREHELSDHVVHPTTLDSLLHVVFAANFKHRDISLTMVPTQFSEVYASSNLLSDTVGESLLLYGKVTGVGMSNLDGDVTAVDRVTGQPVLYFRQCKLSGLQGTTTKGAEAAGTTSLFHQMEWKPDISLLSRAETEAYCQQETLGQRFGGVDSEAELICRRFLYDAIQALDDIAAKPATHHLQLYLRWARAFLEQEGVSTPSLLKQWSGFETELLRPKLIEQFGQSMPIKNDILTVCRGILPVLAGELDPLELMFNSGIAEHIYRSELFNWASHTLAAYLGLVAHKQSDLRILEVGAGTGSTTSLVLDVLSRQGRFAGGASRFSQYDFTDISPGFFSKAQDRYASYANKMRFKVLDIERDPIEQGFEPGSYDIIIAAAVLHATKDVIKTLTNAKKLLKPNGQLVIAEPTNRKTGFVSIIFGLLEGWWLSSDEQSPRGPLLTKEEWNEALRQAGFEGLNIAVSDGPEDCHGLSMLASSPAIVANGWHDDSSTIIVAETASQLEVANSIKIHLQSKSTGVCDIATLSSIISIDAASYSQCVSLIEMGGPILARMTNERFTGLKHIALIAKELIWVNDRSEGVHDNPEAFMITGLGKTIIRENPDSGFMHLNVGPGPSTVSTITKVLDESRRLLPSDHETDMLERDGQVYIPRVVEAPPVNNLFDTELYGARPQPVEVGHEIGLDDSLELRFLAGRLESIHYGPDTLAACPLQTDEICIAIKATGINFKDIMVILNQVSDDHIGQEFSGVVTEVGSATTGAYRPGDRVCGITPKGSFRSYIRAKESDVMKIQDGMSFVEATAIPVAFATAHYGLSHLARLRPGESVLIHAAAGAVGQAAIQLAQGIGAVIFVTVSTPKKKELLMERYGIEPSRIFSSRHLQFAHEIMERTEGKGVDVVLNSLSGQALTDTWRCMAAFGRFVEIGKRDISTFQSLPMEPFQRNVSFCSLDLGLVSRSNHTLMGQIMREVQALVADQRRYTSPLPLTVFPRSGYENAFRLLQTGQHTGKVVVDWQQKDTIQVSRDIVKGALTRLDKRLIARQIAPKSQLDYQFDGNASYLIAGGLGGIGRSVATWMAQNGARHLILLSRSGAKSQSAKDLINRLKNDDVQVWAPQCDVTDDKALKAVVAEAQGRLPPIRGCIQASMVIENKFFQDFTLAEFQAAIDPKVKGTWNLHDHLPNSLDFFVILSSIAGIHGSSTQANYSAANAFTDAFARFRRAHGEHCLALDLGFVEGIGFIAESQAATQALAMTYTDSKQIRESDLHFMLKWACAPTTQAQLNSPFDAQLLGALTTPAFVRRGGVVSDQGWMWFPMFRHLYQMEIEGETGTAVSSGGQRVNSPVALLQAAETLEDAAAVVTNLLVRRIARSLAVPVEDIDTGKAPFGFGVDSLVAIELKFWFSKEIRAEVPVFRILGNSTIAQLGRFAAEKSEHVPKK
ncbi:putative Polyketide synthase [Seiridium cardinale]|uniref:Polyketide synthase n=1 Tax=Seiridium cardinale TaxID=138064 RepID=A0ABR2XR86_9PEZI